MGGGNGFAWEELVDGAGGAGEGFAGVIVDDDGAALLHAWQD